MSLKKKNKERSLISVALELRGLRNKCAGEVFKERPGRKGTGGSPRGAGESMDRSAGRVQPIVERK